MVRLFVRNQHMKEKVTVKAKKKTAKPRTVRRSAKTGEFTKSRAKATTVEEAVERVLWRGLSPVPSVGNASAVLRVERGLMPRRVTLTPALVDGFLEACYSKVAAAELAGIDAEVRGRLEGAGALDKQGRLMLLQRLDVDAEPEAVSALLGGAPLVGIEAEIEVGVDRETQVGRVARGWVEARFSTRPSSGVASVGREEQGS